MKRLIWIVPILLFISACTPDDLTPVQRNTICNALVGPIRYNTYDPNSGRYSGHILAVDLKLRNQIGQALRCPQYKVTYAKSTSRIFSRQSQHRQ